MPIFERKTPEEKQAAREARQQAEAVAARADSEARVREEAARAEEANALAAHVGSLPKWQYHAETINLTSHWTETGSNAATARLLARINQLGSEGWEMISYTSTPVFGPVSQKTTGLTTVAFFKRRAI